MGSLFLRVAVVYVVAGVIFGFAIGITEKLAFANVHAHANLIGWATLALSGLIYTVFPRAGATPLARWHFWLQNVGLPVFLLGLFLIDAGISMPGIPIISVGSILVIAAMLVFLVNVFQNVRPENAFNAQR